MPRFFRLLSITALVLALDVSFACPGSAQSPSTENLWPGSAPGSTAQGPGDVPTLVLTRVESDRPTAAVVILPGGGYHMRAVDHEGHQIAEWFKSLGVTSAICNYRVRGQGNGGQGYGHPAPMLDAQRAIRTLRARANELNIDPNRIGVIGFSAGGHLASTVATHIAQADSTADDPVERVSSRPDFCILCYPVIVFDRDFTHVGSQRNLLGDDPDQALVALLSNERQVTPTTPATFLFHTSEDTVVPATNSVAYYQACLAQGVPAELHIFPNGRHGLGLAQSTPGASQWPGLCANWLRRRGVVTQTQ